ncbi:MAG: histidine phosphatase family protein [Clostridiales bacterium]|nr:histidine phosphatase family protein [Clostridiales bacterium]
MEVLLLRHGKTQGNQEKRYVGCTDEPLLQDAAAELKQSGYGNFHPDMVYVSPMRRCRETAEILFPECMCGNRMIICRELRETDFGAFEYKTYGDLKDNPVYQAWIESGGMLAFPGGESGTDFRQRSRRAFLACLRHARAREIRKAAIVTHGGVIMSVMEAYARPKADFYSWQLQNGCGYHVRTVVGDNGFYLYLL